VNEIIIKGKTFKGDLKKGKQSNALGFMWRPGMPKQKIRIEDCTIDAGPVAEGLKFSYCHDVIVQNCTIIGGFEDCVDIVRGGFMIFEKCRFVSKNTKHHFTIKCNASNITIKDCVFVNDFNKLIDGAFVDLGNWSDYDIDDLPKSKEIYIIDYKFENVSWYKKIIARRLHAETPVNRGSGHILRIPKLFVWLFWKLRRFQVS
tara:strand:+ start:180 stop:788 length:609 start_codon:yes stop_codon:yes gene_type:complete